MGSLFDFQHGIILVRRHVLPRPVLTRLRDLQRIKARPRHPALLLIDYFSLLFTGGALLLMVAIALHAFGSCDCDN